MITCSKFLKRDMFLIVLGCVFKLCESIMELFIPLIMARILNEGLKNGKIAFYENIALLFGIVFLGYAFAFCCQRTAAYTGARYGSALRNGLYSHINKLSVKDLKQQDFATLASRLTADVSYVQLSLSMFIRLATRSPFIAIGSIIMTFQLNRTIAVVLIFLTIALSLTLYILIKSSMNLQKKTMKKFDNIAKVSFNAINGNQMIRSFAKEKQIEQSFEVEAEGYLSNTKKTNKILLLSQPLTTLILNCSIAFILFLSAKFVNASTLLTGEVTAIITYMTQLILSLTVFSSLLITLSRARTSSKRINEIFKLDQREDGGKIEIKQNEEVEITFKDVSFQYDNSSAFALKNLSFSLPFNKSLGILGSTGSGKSTLAKLLLKLYRPTSGDILLNGQNLNDITKSSLNNLVAIAPQQSAIFTKSVYDNIAMGGDFNDGEIEKFAQKSCAYDFVMEKEKGFSHILLEGGKNLSGGQKQRICIARAMAKKSPINIFDNTLSALDNNTAKLVQENILSLNGSKIVISQKISSVINLDSIILLEKGEIVAVGTHKDLIKSNEKYREFFQSQHTMEEGE